MWSRTLVLAAFAFSLAACSDDGSKNAPGSPCATNVDCQDDVCHSGVCVSPNPLRNGEGCNKDYECRSFNCVSGKCAQGTRALGDACRFNEECTAEVCKLQGATGVCGSKPTPDAAPDTTPADMGVPDVAPDVMVDQSPQEDVAIPDKAVPDTAIPDKATPDLPTPDLKPDVKPDIKPDVMPDAMPVDTYVADACACDDGLSCTDDSCGDGGCIATIKPGFCVIGGKCVSTGTLDPTNDCQSCDPSADQKGWSAMTGGSCNDNDDCTHTDTCNAGVCGGTSYTCTANDCQWTSACDGKGGCATTDKPNGAPCQDGDGCTLGDTCDGNGNCLPGPTCNAPPADSCADSSTLRTCTGPGSCQVGSCQYSCQNTPCGAFNACSGAACAGCAWTPAFIQNAQLLPGGERMMLDLEVDPGGNIHLLSWRSYQFANPSRVLTYSVGKGLSGSWPSTDLGEAGKHVGMWGTMALDNLGRPHVAYYVEGDGDLHYRYKGATGWTAPETIDSLGDRGEFASIAVDSAGHAHVAYYDRGSTTGNLMYATNASGQWVSTMVDSGQDVGRFTSIAIDNAGNVHIAYVHVTNKRLRYVTNIGGSFNAPANIGSVAAYDIWWVDLALDDSDKAHIAYYEATSLAGPTPKYRIGNVRYISNSSGSWAEVVLQSGARRVHGVDVTLDAENRPHVVFATEGQTGFWYATSASGSWRTQEITNSAIEGAFPRVDFDGNTVHVVNGHGDTRMLPDYTGGGGGGRLGSKGIVYTTLKPSCP